MGITLLFEHIMASLLTRIRFKITSTFLEEIGILLRLGGNQLERGPSYII